MNYALEKKKAQDMTKRIQGLIQDIAKNSKPADRK